MVKYEIATIRNRHIYMNPKEPSGMPFPQRIDKVISRIRDRIEREVPDKGYFRNFAEDIGLYGNDFYGKAAAICVERDESIDGNALLLLSVLHPSMNMDASVMLTSGSRKDLLDYMNRNGFKQEVINTIHELGESLKN